MIKVYVKGNIDRKKENIGCYFILFYIPAFFLSLSLKTVTWMYSFSLLFEKNVPFSEFIWAMSRENLSSGFATR